MKRKELAVWLMWLLLASSFAVSLFHRNSFLSCELKKPTVPALSTRQQKVQVRVDKKEQIVKIEHKISELRGRLPAHSVKPAMLQELEELEEELARLKKEIT